MNGSLEEPLDAVNRLVAETEERRRDQVRLIARLSESARCTVLAERLLREVECTLTVARAYQSILQSLNESP
ncbi:hypothetical protein [Methylobacterium nigriterrae]|uniref:hypothetical protein n=1 Tax=Methylobacterium nigriterrae TaxID=3127512 RepID=UPI0030137367